MLAVAAAVVTIVVVNTSYFGPQKTVQDYLQALRDGDGAKALGLLHATVPSVNAAVLNGSGLKESQADIKDVSVGKPKGLPGNKSQVTVSYTIDGAKLSTDFELAKGPKHWLFFDTWTFVPATLPTLDVSVINATQASLNGIDVNMPSGKNSFAVFYPGKYDAEYRSDLFAAPVVARNVTGPAAIPAVVLTTGPTTKLLSQVDETIHGYLDACAKQAVLMPADCPLSASTDNRVVSAVKWSIVSYPEVSITAYGGRWVMAPLTTKAQVDFQEQNLYTGEISKVKTVGDFGFSAKLSVTDSAVTVTPVVNY